MPTQQGKTKLKPIKNDSLIFHFLYVCPILPDNQLSELKKNFGKVDCKDSEFVGLQRRYDDESKRRAVKRDVGKPFLKV